MIGQRCSQTGWRASRNAKFHVIGPCGSAIWSTADTTASGYDSATRDAAQIWAIGLAVGARSCREECLRYLPTQVAQGEEAAEQGRVARHIETAGHVTLPKEKRQIRRGA